MKPLRNHLDSNCFGIPIAGQSRTTCSARPTKQPPSTIDNEGNRLVPTNISWRQCDAVVAQNQTKLDYEFLIISTAQASKKSPIVWLRSFLLYFLSEKEDMKLRTFTITPGLFTQVGTIVTQDRSIMKYDNVACVDIFSRKAIE